MVLIWVSFLIQMWIGLSRVKQWITTKYSWVSHCIGSWIPRFINLCYMMQSCSSWFEWQGNESKWLNSTFIGHCPCRGWIFTRSWLYIWLYKRYTYLTHLVWQHPGTTIVTDSVTSDGLSTFIESKLGKWIVSHQKFSNLSDSVYMPTSCANPVTSVYWLLILFSGGKHHRFKRGYKNVIDEGIRLVCDNVYRQFLLSIFMFI